MPDERYAFCRVLIKSSDRSDVEERLARLLQVEVQRRTSTSVEGVLVDVVPNSDAPRTSDLDPDFLLWPIQVEFEPGPGVDGDVVVGLVGRVLVEFWSADQPAVAVCDFENELPWSGGIERVSAAGG